MRSTCDNVQRTTVGNGSQMSVSRTGLKDHLDAFAQVTKLRTRWSGTGSSCRPSAFQGGKTC
jgi:hypothetical protein